ncbi:MAG: PSK operon transcription factor [Acidobacteria bacterium]|nr:MAG: PSK operon transcription factor [Acidobacteriota bacterium]
MPALNIKDAEVRALAQQLAEVTHQTMTEAVKTALREKLESERARDEKHRQRILRRVHELQREIAALPVLDTRSEDEILGYDENGLFK